MSELWPGGIVCRNSSNVTVGSRPAIDSVVGLCTCPAGSVSSSPACTTTGRAVPGRTAALIPAEEVGHVEACARKSHQIVSVLPPSTVSTVPLT